MGGSESGKQNINKINEVTNSGDDKMLLRQGLGLTSYLIQDTTIGGLQYSIRLHLERILVNCAFWERIRMEGDLNRLQLL